ncbi:MAG: bifunctional hydroxymethylpyrimidine kinase/phosphomethylpyrimidine kinase [Nitrosomonadaceae bacterium]
MLQPPPIVLSFSANDSSGGAGIQADTLTLASMGCHPLSVITAVTVQDTVGVDDVMALDPGWVADQARAVLEDMPVHVFKIGMLGSVEIITAVTEIVLDYPDIPVVLDPVFSSGRGDELASEDMISAMRELLLPQTTIITPNSMEARRLAQDEAEDFDELDLGQCGGRILQMGCEYVLITGAHENTRQVTNTLYTASGIVRSDVWQRLAGSYHGSGCTLASAIAATLANGLPVSDGVYEAQEYTWQTLKAGFHPGMGQYLPDRLFWARNEHDSKEEDKPDVASKD